MPVRSVKKAFDLLEEIVFGPPSQEGLSLTHLAEKMGMLPNSTHNILKTLSICGYVAQNADSKYVPGPKCVLIGRMNRLLCEESLRAIHSQLKDLSSRLGESTVVAALCEGDRVVIARNESEQAIKIDQVVLQRGKIYDTPTGRLLAAYAAPEELSKIVARHNLPGKLWDNLTDEDDFHRELKKIRSEELCVIRGKDIIAWACPIPERNGTFSALGCYAPAFRCDDEKEKSIVLNLQKAAAELGRLF